LVVQPKRRLGYGVSDAQEIKVHEFFKDINWTLLEKKEIKPILELNI